MRAAASDRRAAVRKKAAMAADRRQERKSGRGKHAGTWGVRLVTKEVRGLRGVRDTGKYSPPSTQKCQRGSLPLHKKQHKHGNSPGTQASMRSKQAGCGNNGLRTLKCAPSSALHQQLCELESKFARMRQNYRIEVYINLCPQFFAKLDRNRSGFDTVLEAINRPRQQVLNSSSS